MIVKSSFTHFIDYTIQYYKDGTEHIPLLDFEGWIYDRNNPSLDEQIANISFTSKINKPYQSPCSYSPEPIETVAGFVYAGERIKLGDKQELWKYNIKIVWRGWKTFRKKPNN